VAVHNPVDVTSSAIVDLDGSEMWRYTRRTETIFHSHATIDVPDSCSCSGIARRIPRTDTCN